MPGLKVHWVTASSACSSSPYPTPLPQLDIGGSAIRSDHHEKHHRSLGLGGARFERVTWLDLVQKHRRGDAITDF